MLLALPFKGDRNYLHGTDIFNCLDLHFRDLGGFLVSLSFRSFANTQLQLIFEKESLPPNSILAEGIVQYPSQQSSFWLVQSEHAVTSRFPFNESLITHHAIVDSSDISLSVPNNYNLIENLVILSKHVSNILSPLDSGRWIFGKIKLNQAFPLNWQSILISRIAYLEARFCRYSVSVDKVNIGEILFIVAP